MLEAEAELMEEREEWTMERASCSLTVPTEPVRRWCRCEEAGRRMVDE